MSISAIGSAQTPPTLPPVKTASDGDSAAKEASESSAVKTSELSGGSGNSNSGASSVRPGSTVGSIVNKVA
jgi:hypothetical protein